MNKTYLLNWKVFIMVLVILSGITFLTSAQNETCTNNICPINESISNLTLKNITKANCSEQLTMLLNSYNDLIEDYKNGTNCGTIKELLLDNNKKLSDNLKECKSDVDKNKIYMVGFYFLFTVMIILIIYFVYMSTRPKL